MEHDVEGIRRYIAHKLLVAREAWVEWSVDEDIEGMTREAWRMEYLGQAMTNPEPMTNEGVYESLDLAAQELTDDLAGHALESEVDAAEQALAWIAYLNAKHPRIEDV